MTKPQYRSSTGLYSMRHKSDLIHEGLTIQQVQQKQDYYQSRHNNPHVVWPFDPKDITVEEFSGEYVLRRKGK